MSAKDWIVLIVPILCNGVVVLFLQKTFEKRQLALTEKYKYVSVMQQKIDDALALFVNVLQATGDDAAQIGWLNQFISGYSKVHYYYQQNQVLFKPLKKYMDEMIEIHTQIQNDQRRGEYTEYGRLEESFRRIYELLQSMQNDCIKRRI